MTRNERSAGAIIYRAAPDDPGKHLFLLLDYGRHWDFPKGHLEAGEDDRTAALRELAEETGIADVRLDPAFKHEIEYYFRDKKGRLIRKTVAFFLGRTPTDAVHLSHEHVGYAFLAYPDAVGRVTYANAREVLALAAKHLATVPSGPDRRQGVASTGVCASRPRRG